MGAGKVDAESRRGKFLKYLSKLMGEKKGKKRLKLVNRVPDKSRKNVGRGGVVGIGKDWS